jgi:hypothetical protein
MSSKYRVQVFGKLGCNKCKALNRRVEKLLSSAEWADFDNVYTKLDTIDGLVEFCSAECINPSRIPAVMILKEDPESKEFRRIPESHPENWDKVFGKSRLYSYLGLQTDYSLSGRGVLTPKMLKALMEEARKN